MDVLLDTHTWVWTLDQSHLLSQPARQALSQASAVRVSPITFFEIGQKVRIGKWPEMEPHISALPTYLADQGAVSAPLTHEIALLAATLDWDHRDPFDRILAATAITTQAALISSDTMFDSLTNPNFRRIW